MLYICRTFIEALVIWPVFVGIAVASAQLAHEKGYLARWWFLYSLILPIFTLGILFLMKKREKQYSKYHRKIVYEHNDKVLYRKPDDAT
jgi:hypothetical protein